MKITQSKRNNNRQKRSGRRDVPHQTYEGQSLPRGAASATSGRNHAPIRIENPEDVDCAPIPPAHMKKSRMNPVVLNDNDAPVPPAQLMASLEAREKAMKNALVNPEEIQDDDVPVPPELIAARYDPRDDTKSSGLVGTGATLMSDGHAARSSEMVRHSPALPSPQIQQSPPTGTESNPAPGAVRVDGQGSGQVGINVRPTPQPMPQDTGEESEPEAPLLEATLVEDEESPVYDAVAVQAGGALEHHENNIVRSPLETNVIKIEHHTETERCLWKYVLVLLLLAIIGLAAYFIIKYTGAVSQSLHCNPIDCEVSSWQSWTPCTERCDGRRNRTREVVRNVDCDGHQCPHVYEEQDCNIDCCIDCEVTFWSKWTPCSERCDGGLRNRTRTVVKENDICGRPCPSLIETQDCNTQECCIDCQLTAWSNWSSCSASCDGGTRNRSRTIVQEPTKCGKPCPFLNDEQECNMDPCVDCQGQVCNREVDPNINGLNTDGPNNSGPSNSGPSNSGPSNSGPSNSGPSNSCPTATECDSDDDCLEPGMFCSDNPNCRNATCVYCDTPDDCPSENEFCDCVIGACVVVCQSDTDCQEPEMYCSQDPNCRDHTCIQRESTQHCPEFCNIVPAIPPDGGNGISCLSNSDCLEPGMFCSEDTNCAFRQCVSCIDDSDCLHHAIDWNAYCDCQTGECRCHDDCCSHADCPGDKFCSYNPDCLFGQCVLCGGENECPFGQKCDCARGECVKVHCDCPNPSTDCDQNEYCDCGSHECKPRKCDYDCCDNTYCDGEKTCRQNTCGGSFQRCMECVADSDCQLGFECDCLNGICSEKECEYDCCDDSDCDGKEFCSPAPSCRWRKCTECVTDEDCPDWEKLVEWESDNYVLNDVLCNCNTGECEPFDPPPPTCDYDCCDDSECKLPKTCRQNTCGGSFQRCMECVTDSDCQLGFECDCPNGICLEKECEHDCCDDSDCDGKEFCSPAPSCRWRKCTECLADEDCPDWEKLVKWESVNYVLNDVLCNCNTGKCEPFDPPPPSCDYDCCDDSECKLPKKCRQNTCFGSFQRCMECVTDSDCQFGFECDCPKGLCLKKECEYDCCDDSDCDGKEFCSPAPSCRWRKCTECVADEDCPDWEKLVEWESDNYVLNDVLCNCNTGKCEPFDPPPPSCDYDCCDDSECKKPKKCRQNTCFGSFQRCMECVTNSDCQFGFECDCPKGECVEGDYEDDDCKDECCDHWDCPKGEFCSSNKACSFGKCVTCDSPHYDCGDEKHCDCSRGTCVNDHSEPPAKPIGTKPEKPGGGGPEPDPKAMK